MNNNELVEKIKEFLFNNEIQYLCDTIWCGLKDGYCPRYDCGLIDKLKSFYYIQLFI